MSCKQDKLKYILIVVSSYFEVNVFFDEASLEAHISLCSALSACKIEKD